MLVRARILLWAAFGLGLGLSILLVVRGQLGGDQLDLLARGWLLAERGVWIPFGNPMSTGGHTPGGLTSLLVGLPLALWRDYRSPGVLVLLFHVAGWLLLDGAAKALLSARERVVLAAVYWLSPWRMYFSGFLWNPSYLFVFGALHFASSMAQRERARFWASFAQSAGIVLALQLHPSALLLLVASALLWLRGAMKPHWLGGVVGAAVGGLPLVPWALELGRDPGLVTEASKGFLFRGLVLVFPLLRGLGNGLRYASLALPEKVARFDFSAILGADPWLGPVASALVVWLLPLTVIFPLAANLRLLRRGGRWNFALTPMATSGREWLRSYWLCCLAAALLVYALAPTTPMYWQGVVLFHAAVLPVVLWWGALWRTRRRSLAARGLAIWVLLEVALTLAMAFGSPQFRCGGRQGLRFPLASHSPMFEDLNIQQTCPWPLDQDGTWWPDVLPRGDAKVPSSSPHG